MQRAIASILVLFGAGMVHAQDDGFKPMFNGKDLSGWVNVNCAPSSWYVKDGMVITTGKPTGYLRTERMYENFIAEFEWFHAPDPKGSYGNSGFFVWCDPIPTPGIGYTRGIEVQVLVNLLFKDKKGNPTATSHGDIFPIHGATCKPDRPHPTAGSQRCLPSENNCKGEYEWNHYRVVANNGIIKLTVNGKEVSGVSESSPRKGYLALESEGSECRFKNVKIKELPSTNPKPSEVCDEDKGFKYLFTGLDLAGWKVSDDAKEHWAMKDGTLSYSGKATTTAGRAIASEKSFGDCEIVCDFTKDLRMLVRGESSIPLKATAPKGYNRAVIQVKGEKVSVTVNGKQTMKNIPYPGLNKSGPISLACDSTAGQFRNLFVRDLK